MTNFEVLDAKIASALNRIIHNSHFKRRISLEEQKAQKEDRFLRGRQIAYLIYEYFRVTGANDSVDKYADLFAVGLRNDDFQEFDSKWDGILLSMTKISPDDILEGMYKLRNSRPYWNCMTWRFIGILAPELKIKRETPWSRIKGQNSVDKKFLEIVGNGEANGLCSKGDN